MPDGIGLSVGATNLTAVIVGRTALTRTPVLTRYPHRPPEVGVPSENPDLTERGLILTDFVDRVGDPVGIVAPDGSTHVAATVLAEALQALLRAAAGTPAEPVGVTYPAHWRPAAIEALRGELAALEGLAATPLLSDADAAMTALQHDPGLPTSGIIALCDFGGTGTSITFADAADGYRPVAPTLRYAELSGELIDQALLNHVLTGLTAADAVDGSETSAIGSLSRLRAQCRTAKERLSTAAATTLVTDLPDPHAQVRLTRDELDAVLRPPLDDFLTVLQDTMDRNGIRLADLAAVATVGGGARIPSITTALSERFRTPVVTTPQPELTAAIGAGLTAVRAPLAGPLDDDSTQLAPAVPAALDQADTQQWEGDVPTGLDAAAAAPALAWSQADDIPEVYAPEPTVTDAGPEVPEPASDEYADQLPWYRRPPVLFAGGALAVLTTLTVAIFTMRGDDTPAPASTTETATAEPTTTEEPLPPAEPPASQPAPPQTVYETVPPPQPAAPPPAEPTAEPPPPAPEPTAEPPPPPPEPTEEAPPEPTAEPPPTTPPPATEAPPPTTEAPATTTRPRWLPTLPRPTLPTIPRLPSAQTP